MMTLVQIFFVVLALLLFFACALLLALELFIPSFGLLTLTALLCLAGGVALFFSMSSTGGWIGVFLAILLIPSSWWGFYWLFPKTVWGRVLLFQYPSESLGAGVPGQDELTALKGRSGVTFTDLRPVGICKFDKKKIVCISETEYIDKGESVTVLDVEGNKVVVRKL